MMVCPSYITHPIAVAGLCAEWKLDAQAIMAALMHDAMEDCGVSKPELIERFGAPTADLVDGLTKLDKLHFSTREESQAESFRKMLLAMARDVRVILIKLADRLHNMRTMDAMAPAKRVRIAGETLEIYAPIAHRLGLNQTYRELQELSFQHLHPWRHEALSKAVTKARGYRRDIVERIQRDVEKTFALDKLKAQVPTKCIFRTSGRSKSAFPMLSASPNTKFPTPAGKPASSKSPIKAIAVNGVYSDGFATNVQPAANEAAQTRAIFQTGKFQAVMIPTTPTGCEMTDIRLLLRLVAIVRP